jgi:pimeloyl-[acyl-carrier protein] methyl ester esterase
MSSSVNPPITRFALPVESLGNGVDLVLLHGWGLHSEFFRPWLPLLLPHCRLHLIDLPGHGVSKPCTPYTLAAMAETVAQSMRSVADRYAVAGWSLGGAVAQRLAIDFPQTVTHLITIASSPRFLRTGDWPHAATAHALELLHDGLKRDYTGTLAQFFELNLAAKYRTLADELAALATRRPAAHMPSLDDGLALTKSVDLRAEVGAIKAPVLAISGRLDRLSYSQSSAWLANVCRGTHLDLPHSAHIPHLSNPVECASAIIEHLQKMGPG